MMKINSRPNKWLFGICLALLMNTHVQAQELTPPTLRTRLIEYPTTANGPKVSAIYRIPVGQEKVPAVIILHGSGGMDSRGTLHALDLGRAGIATLELDMWGARGIAGGASGRPAKVHDTLPDLWGALTWLSQQPDIDGAHIGAVGFSWGGAMAMLAATNRYGEIANTPLPVALAAFYPVCWGYNRVPGYDFKQLRPIPLLILGGETDGYDDDQAACSKLVAHLPAAEQERITVHMFSDAGHGFNMLEAPVHYDDPFAHRGKGGDTVSAANSTAREEARLELIRFFVKTLTASAPQGNTP